MKTSRRTFLRVLGSAIVGAAVALPRSTSPLVIYEPENPRADKLWGTVVVDPAEPLTYARLERAYYEAMDSGPPPSLLPVRSMERRQTLSRETGLLYDVELAA